MAVVSIKNKLRRGNLLVGNTAFDPAAMDSIATVTVGSGGAANVEFTSIPSTYTHLQIRGILRDSRATYGNGSGFIEFNSDTAANYSWHQLLGDGSNPIAYSGANASYMQYSGGAGDGAPANTFGVMIIDILDYANTNKYKTIRTLDGVDINGTVAGYGGIAELASGSWRSTSAITSIKIRPNSPNYKQYTSFALYGIKSA